jgi:hypothetical protein
MAAGGPRASSWLISGRRRERAAGPVDALLRCDRPSWSSRDDRPPNAHRHREMSPADDVELAYECARRRRQTNDERLKRRIRELGVSGRRGCATLDRIIALHEAKAPTGSALEVRFLQLNRRFRLPDPECQRIIKDRDGSIARVDFMYPGTVVIVEVDGRSVHAPRLGETALPPVPIWPQPSISRERSRRPGPPGL